MTRIKKQCNNSRNDLYSHIKLFGYGVVLAFGLSACDSVETTLAETTLVNSEKNVGYFVSNFNDSVDYICENRRKSMDNDGKFECASFPIAFYMDEAKIGEISKIHKDGYVYPQDIIMLEVKAPVYTSDNGIKYLNIE